MSSLEETLRRTIKGEVLFDAASRGRYATDASIYQIEPVGVFVPRDETDVALALDIARDAKAADPAARRRHLAVRPDGGRRRWSSTSRKHLRKVVGFDADRADGRRSSPASCSTSSMPG